MPTASFAHRVVWITGASSGIGESLAHAFARRGARLVLSARRRDELDRVASTCTGASSVHVHPLDLADTASLAAHAKQVLSDVGDVDVMVHNGGVSQRARALDTSVEVDDRLMRVNYLGAVALTKALLPSMIARNQGRFVVVSSLVGIIGSPMRSGYAASKHALHGFFDSLRAEHHDDGISVTIACPGFVRTGVSIHALTGTGAPQGTMDTATDRGIEPDACAERIVRAVERGKREVYVGGYETIAVYLKRYAPSMFERLLRRARVV
jgi:short-subunit dehydrogenase